MQDNSFEPWDESSGNDQDAGEQNESLAWGDSTGDNAPAGDVVSNEDADNSPDTVVAETPTALKRRKVSAVVVSSLGWSDVYSVFDFVNKFNAIEQPRAALFRDVFGIPDGDNAIDVARHLSSAQSEVAAFSIVLDIVNLVSTGVVGFQDGIRLVTKIDALPDLMTKSLARQLSSITSVDIRHRKNSQTTEFVATVFDALDKSRESGRLEKLDEFKELLEVWPENKR